MSSSAVRAATMLTGLRTEPILRSASSPDSAQVTGDISVWPNTATLVTPGKAPAIRVSRVVVAGAAPQAIVFSADRSRLASDASSHSSCHRRLRRTGSHREVGVGPVGAEDDGLEIGRA